MRAVARAALAATAAGALGVLASGAAHADPLFEPPVIGKARWGGAEGDPVVAGLVLDVRLLGVIGGHRLSLWPDRELGLEPGQPLAAALRAGAVLHLVEAPWTFALQLDLAESLRPGRGGVAPWQGAPGAFVGAVVDDAYVLWRPARAAQLVLGRARVPFSKWRQYDERDIALGAVPFVVDRVAPDRRWGLLLHGDLGQLAYAAGIWEDLDALEPRVASGDVAEGGQLAGAAHVEWTPIAPIMGSNPVGKVTGARGALPTPRADPWFATQRVSVGLGLLWRRSEAGAQRYDFSIAVKWKWRWLAALGEALVLDGARLGVHGELAITPVDRVSLHLRGEVDPGEAAGGVGAAWTAGGGIMWHATADRRSRIGFYGWYRRVERAGGRNDQAEDAAIVLVQTAL